MADETDHPLPRDPIGFTPALARTPDLRSLSILPPRSKLDDATKQAVRWMFHDSKFVPLALVCGMAEVDISETREEAQAGLDRFLADLKQRRNVEPDAVAASVQPATIAEALAYLGVAGVVVSDTFASRLQLLVRHQLGVETSREHCTRWMMPDVTRAKLILRDPRDAGRVLNKAWTVFQQRRRR